MKVAVFGLGKLGLPMAAVFADSGHSVRGVDLSQATVDALNEGRVLIQEPGLKELVSANSERLSATTSVEEALDGADISFVIVPTPSGPDDAFVNSYVEAALTDIGRVLAGTGRDHLVVIASTVMPGSTQSVLAPALERELGSKLGRGVELCYSPEFIALGTVVSDLLNPDMILVGARNIESGKRLVDFYQSVSGSDIPFSIMSWSNAELAKIAVNSYVTMKISFANMIADMCEALPNGDVDAVTEALGLDSRIGPKYLKGGLAFGGPCFPRDNRAIARFAQDAGVPAPLPIATDEINVSRPKRIVAAAQDAAPGALTAAVLGISYKPKTPVYEESPGLAIARELAGAGIDVTVYDESVNELHDRDFKLAPSASAAVSRADVIVLASDNEDYKEAVHEAPRDALIIDCWRSLDAAEFSKLLQVGRPVNGAPQETREAPLEASS